jgi:hypothetical protein
MSMMIYKAFFWMDDLELYVSVEGGDKEGQH